MTQNNKCGKDLPIREQYANWYETRTNEDIFNIRKASKTQPIPSQSVDEPFAYYVYIDGLNYGYFVDSLHHSQCVYDCANADARITPLYTKPQPTSQDLIGAERYRFMRETNMTDIYSDLMTYKLNPFSVDFVDLDVAIDAAMKESE